MRIFISVPMKGFSDEEIEMEYKTAIKYLNTIGYTSDNEFLNCNWQEKPPNGYRVNNLYYLGKSIQTLGTADMAVFWPGWQEYRGCIIEHSVASLYNILIYHLPLTLLIS